jgi:hypothetical protein
VIALIKTLVDLLARNNITVTELAKALGTVTSGGANNVPLKIQPNNAAVKEARIVRDGESETPSHVDLTPAVALNMHDLVAAFGKYHEMPRSTNPNKPPSVSFRVQAQTERHPVTIFASYADNDDDDAANSAVVALMLRRD